MATFTQTVQSATKRLRGELIEVPALLGDYIVDFGQALQRLTCWLQRWDDPAQRDGEASA